MKYYKLRLDFYQLPEVRWLMKQKDGFTYIIIYQMLATEAIKEDNGILMKHVEGHTAPYSTAELAALVNTDMDTMRCALNFLERVKFIRHDVDGYVRLPTVEKQVRIDKLEKKYEKKEPKADSL